MNLPHGLGRSLNVDFRNEGAPEPTGINAIVLVEEALDAMRLAITSQQQLKEHPTNSTSSNANELAEKASRKVSDLVNRAIGSWHIEVLSKWLTDEVSIPASGAFSNLDQFRAAVWRGYGEQKSLIQVESYRRFVELRSDSGDDDMLAITAAASAAFGFPSPALQTWKAIAEISTKLMQITVPGSMDGPYAVDVAAQTLASLIAVRERLRLVGRPVMLCEPIPVLSPIAYATVTH